MHRYCNRVSGVSSGNNIYFWKSKGLSDENITVPNTSDYKLNPELSFFGTKIKVEFNGNCLKQDKTTYNHEKVVNIYIVYEISRNINISDYPIIENCLFGAVSLTKMLVLIRISILDMELDLIDMDFFIYLLMVQKLIKLKQKILRL